MKTTSLIIALALGLVVGILVGINLNFNPTLGGVQSYYDTTASGFTHTTSTINTTSTQVFASVVKLSGIQNTTANQLTCSLDATGTTAASSTVASGRGIIIGPAYLTTSTLSNVAAFGECGNGEANCYRHKGAVNCLAGAASIVTKWVQ